MLPTMHARPLLVAHPLEHLYDSWRAHDTLRTWHSQMAHRPWHGPSRGATELMVKARRLSEHLALLNEIQLHDERTPSWRALDDRQTFETSVQLPAEVVDDESLAGQLADDGRSLTITVKPASCACKSVLLAEIILPEALSNVELRLSDNGLLTVRASKKKPALKIIKASPPPDKEQVTREVAAELPTREVAAELPTREVAAEQEERELDSKFKLVVNSAVKQREADMKVTEEPAETPSESTTPPPRDETVPEAK